MFLGEFEHTIDDKGRLAVPARFRDYLAQGVVITRGFDACLIGFTRQHWDRLAQKISGLSFGQSGARDIQRRLFSAATDLPVDKQGRILIPQTLREFAGLGENVMVTGMNDYFEIWAPDRWKAVLEKIDSDPSAFAQQLFDLGI